MVYISLLQHSDTGVKATWPITGEYYMVTLWLYLSNCPPEEDGLGFITTLTMHGDKHGCLDYSITRQQTSGLTSP